MNKIKLSIVVTSIALLLIFCLQNMAVVEVDFLAFQISIPRAFLLLLVYLIGLISGMILLRSLGKAKN